METIEYVGCVLLDDYGRLLLLHKTDGDTGYWELPEVMLEEDELPEIAAVRAAKFNFDVSVKIGGKIGEAQFEGEEEQAHLTWYRAEITSGEPTIVDAVEYDDFEFFETADLTMLALSPTLHALSDKIFSGEVSL